MYAAVARTAFFKLGTDNVCSCYPWTKSTRLWLTVGPAVTPEVFSTSSKSDSFCVLQYEDHQHLFQHPTSWLIRAPTISSFQNSPAAHKFTSYSQIHQLLINFQHHFPPLQIQWPISTYHAELLTYWTLIHSMRIMYALYLTVLVSNYHYVRIIIILTSNIYNKWPN